MIEQLIKGYIDTLKADIEPTIDNIYQFKQNFNHLYKIGKLKAMYDLIQTHKSFINQKVYKYNDKFIYSVSFQETGKLSKNRTLFTKEKYDEFKIELLKTEVLQLLKRLTTKPLNSENTCKFLNLTVEWEMECDQFLLKIYKALLEISLIDDINNLK